MKRFVPILLSYCLSLTVVGSCKKDPPVEEPAPNLANCRIVKTTYKTPTIGFKDNQILNAEQVKLDDGSKVNVGTVTTSTYFYDEQNRINQVLKKYISDHQEEEYIYYADFLIHTDKYTSVMSGKVFNRRDTIPLNEKGRATRASGLGSAYFGYNADGQLLSGYIPRPTHQYENGNLVRRIENASWEERNGTWVPTTDYILKRFTYDLTRPNLPVVYQFWGKASRNLPLEEIWETQQGADFPSGPVYRKTFTYTYDKWGRVKRRVAHGIPLVRGWLIEDDSYGVGVTDYEYSCN